MEIYPNESRQFIQENRGHYSGNTFATYGIDLTTEKGVARVSAPVLQNLKTADDADFAGYAGAIVEFSGKYWAISNRAFVSSFPNGGWAQASIAGADPDTGNTTVDAVVFNGKLLVSGSTDIYFNTTGTTWDNNLWWTEELGQSALTNGRHHMRVGPDKNLYITDINKLYKVDEVADPDEIKTSGDGTLDYSATEFEFTCLEMSSTRAWIGTEHTEGGEAVILEWDLSATSTTPNREHKMGSSKVMCIAIWNDTPIAILKNGKVKYFDGSSFVDFPGIQFPSAITDVDIEGDFIHPNGWAIIDNLPHFLIKGSVQTSGNAFTDDISSLWNMPSGVWCLDPERGLYNRFPVGYGQDTQDDYGQLALRNVGALYSVEKNGIKFLASYEIHTGSSTNDTVLAYLDPDRTHTRRAWLATKFYTTFKDAWSNIEIYFKRLQSGEKIKIWYRSENTDAVTCSGTWYSTTQFNTTDDIGDIEVGNMMMIKAGAGAGQLVKIVSITQNASVNEIVVEDAPIGVVANDTSGVQLLDFKILDVVDSTTIQNLLRDIPSTKKLRKMQFLFEFQQNASSTMEFEYSIIK